MVRQRAHLSEALEIIEIIDNHSVRTDLLRPSRSVLDVGARGFRFARAMMDRGMNVIALDPDPTVEDPHINGVTYMRTGLIGGPLDMGAVLVMHPDPEARHVSGPLAHTHFPTVPVECTTMPALMEKLGMVEWDLVKLNCEGAEYDILQRWGGPWARQVVVSFHEHTPQRRGKAEVKKCIELMRQWYEPVQHIESARYGAGMNWWDTLLLLKEVAGE